MSFPPEPPSQRKGAAKACAVKGAERRSEATRTLDRIASRERRNTRQTGRGGMTRRFPLVDWSKSLKCHFRPPTAGRTRVGSDEICNYQSRGVWHTCDARKLASSQAQVCQTRRGEGGQKKRLGRRGVSALGGGMGNGTATRTTRPTALMQPLPHPESVSTTGFTAVSVLPCTRPRPPRRHHACNLQTRSRHPKARPVATRRSVAPFIDIREEKKGYG